MHFKRTLSLLLAIGTSVLAAEPSGHDLMQKALRKERVEGDLKGAIELYRQIATDHAADRPLAAQALLQLGRSYEHLGATEARRTYERLVREYADQTSEVAEARQRIEKLDALTPANNGDRGLLIQKITPGTSELWDHWVAFGDTRPLPDGRYFGYVNWAHGNLGLCDIATGEVRDLTTEGTWEPPDQFTWGAIWSPDSTQIAYIWIKGDEGDLRVINRSGGQPRILVSRANGGSIAPCDWSRDGRYLVGLAPIQKRPAGAGGPLRIVRVEVATGLVTVVKELPVGADNVSISLSPDGRYLAHDTPVRAKAGPTAPPNRINVVGIDGTTDRPLLDHPAPSSSPFWSPDGRQIVFRSQRSGEDGLWTVPVKDGAAVGEPSLVRAGFAGSRPLGFAHDGSFYYTASTPRMNVFIAEADFPAGTMGEPRLVSTRHDGKNQNACWSADGSQLGYLSLRSAGWPPGGALVFHNIATSAERDVPVAALNFFSPPAWSADLGQLAGPAMIPGSDDDARRLYVVNAGTGERARFLDKDASSVNYTRDGRHLIYVHHVWNGPASTRELVERDLVSGAERVIVRGLENLGFKSQVLLSPDETTLAHCHRPYAPSGEQKTSLFLTSRTDGAMRPVWELPQGTATVFDWLPDNRHVLVSVEDRHGTQQLRVIDTVSGQDRVFGPTLRGQDKVSQVSIHPDGKRIAFTRGGVVREIWMMKNLPGAAVAAN